MDTPRMATHLTATLLLLGVCGASAQTPPQSAATDLKGTSWRLVKFQGSDDKTLTPDDSSKYTITFNADGSLSARIDCNRGRGTWKSSGPARIEFGPGRSSLSVVDGRWRHLRVRADSRRQVSTEQGGAKTVTIDSARARRRTHFSCFVTWMTRFRLYQGCSR
jgi:hypothetical protein